EFVLLDNFYTSGTNSADGHQWTSTAIANGYTEQNYAATIRSYPYDGGDPLAFSPEGFLWTAAMDRGISVQVYGEFVDKPVVRDPATWRAPTFKQLWDAYKAGEDKYEIRAETSQAALRKVLHPRFIGFPSIVSDQWRADQFLAEFRDWEKDGKMPEFLIFLFPNDHTAGTSPGMPTPRAAVADNDLALGRVVEAISKSRFWKETLILVIEDDSQLGLDHVDGHRTVGYAISPYTKRGAVVSEMYNHTSFIRTMGLVLGFPALTRFDRGATPLTACFTDKPDLRPYTHRPANIPLDELNPPRNQLKGEALKWAIASEKLNWKDVDLADATTVARAVWHAQMRDRPFPWDMFRPNLDED
ncbi:MAG TPA: alkaline phosphatase family protein, partial [Fimbriimonadaceae bacterium]|nr:alkaline phosphatase family protein [Fimbriimonadaceae bacterium]